MTERPTPVIPSEALSDLGVIERRERAEEARRRANNEEAIVEANEETTMEEEAFTVEETRRQMALQTAMNLVINNPEEDPLGTLLNYAKTVENYLADGTIAG